MTLQGGDTHAHEYCREVTSSALAACKKRWPQIFGALTSDQEARISEGMRAVRPVLIKGHESMVMVSVHAWVHAHACACACVCDRSVLIAGQGSLTRVHLRVCSCQCVLVQVPLVKRKEKKRKTTQAARCSLHQLRKRSHLGLKFQNLLHQWKRLLVGI